ncbi:MAG: phage virion morphogenesis protein [Flammeovirgaceae bacterium]|jgi:hypothetical protein|nr:phage virion morphogenesis protein [Flammeovirgaceae bacterium]
MSIEQAIANLQALKGRLKKLVAKEMVNTALDNIKRQTDVNGVSFAKRKPGAPRDAGRLVLVDIGDGRRSITASVTATGVQLTANDYMEAHNEGANITATAIVREHTRRRAGRSARVRSHTRRMNTQLPARTFFADSPRVRNRLDEMVQNQILEALT